jgi:squalene-associated FAD-dependent desaturase
MKRSKKHIAVIGGGWAGCAAAVELTAAGHQVALIEASRILGGRARSLRSMRAGLTTPQPLADWESKLDNGQHILLGAYRETLRLMRLVGVNPDTALLRLPLQMRYPSGCGGMDFLSARLPAPWHVIAGLWRATGLARSEKMALARFTTAARWIDWRLNQDCSVSELLIRFEQPARLIILLWRPLCLAALNTPPQNASAQIFLNVLRDSLGAGRAASDMLIPRVDLSSLFPAPAASFLQTRGGEINFGKRVQSIANHEAKWQLSYLPIQNHAVDRQAHSNTDQSRSKPIHHAERNNPVLFEGIVLATPISETRRVLLSWRQSVGDGAGAKTEAEAETGKPLLDNFSYQSITTCYLQYASTVRLTLPFYALIDDPKLHRFGQFVFDRGQLDATQSGLLAVVISASAAATTWPHDQLATVLAEQLADAFDRSELRQPVKIKVISEKRATFSCHPDLIRPISATDCPTLVLAGDFIDSAYPATLESAVQSGVHAARLLMKSL